MSIKLQQLSFEGGVNLKADPHLLKANEWLKLENMWPYKDKFIGTRPSLLHEQDVLPVPGEYWNGHLQNNTSTVNPAPTAINWYGQWFRFLTPLKAIFLGDLSRIAMICVCNKSDVITLKEHFEGEAETIVTLTEGEVILILTPNDLQNGPDVPVGLIYPTIAGVRLGRLTNITPTLIEFNGAIIAANKGCEYVVKVVHSDMLALPSATVWPSIDYRFTKVNFGATNLDFKPDGAIVYKNRFVYWKGNKIWFSDAFQPEVIYANAVATAYLGVFFNTGLTEDITALGVVYLSDKEQIAETKLAIWTQHGMLTLAGEPATSIASTPVEFWVPCTVSDLNIPAGCISGASIVKTKYGLIWCGAESVWFMQGDAVPTEVGYKISPRIAAQSFESAGRIFATFDDLCYRLVINKPGVGFNPYDALGEMWCLSFIGDKPTKESAAWFGPQTFTNTDNPIVSTGAPGGESGLFCCAKLNNTNDDKTWYIQPYSCTLGDIVSNSDLYGTRLGLASLSTYLGVDITAPFRNVEALDVNYSYNIGMLLHFARSVAGENYNYATEYVVTAAGVYGGTLEYQPVYVDNSATPLYSKRLLTAKLELTDLMPLTHKISVQSGNLTFDNPELEKLIDGYELTFKTLNPIIIESAWWPWQPSTVAANIVTLQSRVKVPNTAQNLLDGLFNEPVLTSRLIPAPANKRFNGVEAQLNINEPEYKIVTSNNGVVSPSWNIITIGFYVPDAFMNPLYVSFNLFDFDATTGIAKYATLSELVALLQAKVLAATGKALSVENSAITGIGFKFTDETQLHIDLKSQGWEWFGFIPTNLDNGFGLNIVSNLGNETQFIYATGPCPPCTPRSIHFAKLNVRYDVFEARPR